MSDANASPSFVIRSIYLKDLSFESPNTPVAFQEEWKPERDTNLVTQVDQLDKDTYQVTLKITTTVSCQSKTLFLIEVQKAGIFELTGFSEQQLPHMLGSFCPNVLFPYARQVISEVVVRGGFPPLYLEPINFDVLFAEQQKQAAATAEKQLDDAEAIS